MFHRYRRPLIGLLLLPVVESSAGDPRPSPRVPAGAIAALWITPDEGGADAGSLGHAASFLGSARSMGLLSGIGFRDSLILDIVAAVPELMAASPLGLAIAVTDVRSQSLGDGSHKLAGLEAAIVLRPVDLAQPVPGLIQQFLNRYTNSDVARVVTMNDAGMRRFRLVDTRLPDWAVFEWGAVGQAYVIAFGEGAFDSIGAAIQQASASLGDGDWFREAWAATDAGALALSLYVDFERLASALASGLGDKTSDVLSSLKYGDVRRALWSIGAEGRALRWNACKRVADLDRRSQLATPLRDDERSTDVVPPDAEWYALFDWNASSFVNSVSQAYVQARSPGKQQELRQYWHDVQRYLEISIERDLLGQLGRRFIMHNDPPHPLGLDLLCTLQFEIAGSPHRVSETVEKLLDRWRFELRERGQAVTLDRARDGVWYLRIGIYGPAVAIHDRWVIVGPSPAAVRHNIRRIERATAAADEDRLRP